MKLKLPHKTYDLDMDLEVEERLKCVNEILMEKIDFHKEKITIEDYFHYTFEDENSKRAMDTIGYFITKEDRNLEILSNNKQNEMKSGSKRHTTFSSMGYDNQVAVGLIDNEFY